MKNFRRIIFNALIILCVFCFALGFSACQNSDSLSEIWSNIFAEPNESGKEEINPSEDADSTDEANDSNFELGGNTDDEDTENGDVNEDNGVLQTPEKDGAGDGEPDEDTSDTLPPIADDDGFEQEDSENNGNVKDDGSVVPDESEEDTSMPPADNSEDEDFPKSDDMTEHIHCFDNWITTYEPTCTLAGSKISYCLCGEMQTEIISSLGHDLTEKEGQLPTCGQSGWEEYKECSRCGYSEKTELPQLGHNYAEWVVKTPSDCLNAGEEMRICSNDESHVEFRITEAVGHCPEHRIELQAACGIQGLEQTVCYVCNEVLEAFVIPALNHSYGEWTTLCQPTCTDEGTERRFCIYDPAHFEERAIDKTGHCAGDWLVTAEPSCFTDGKKIQMCSYCNEEIQSELLPASGHSYDDNVCVNCGYDFGGTKGLSWKLGSDGESYVLCGIGSATESHINIPSEYNGKPVVEISAEAFIDNKEIISIFIPESILIINPYAFYGVPLTCIEFEFKSDWFIILEDDTEIALSDNYFNDANLIATLLSTHYAKYLLVRR